MTKFFRTDNTEGYDADDLAALNQAIDYVVESNTLTDKSAIDHAMETILAAYDQGARRSALIQAYERATPWPYPPSYLTPKGPVR